MVSYDLKQVRKAWHESALRDFDEAKAAELVHIDLLEQTYWRAWLASQGEHSSRTQRVVASADGMAEVVRMVARTVDQVGDPRFLQGVQRCIELRCAILGLDVSEHE